MWTRWWDVFQNQILGMHWLDSLVGSALTALGVDVTTRLGASLQFFIYDTVKILVLLSVLIFAVSYIQSYFPPERTRRILSRYKGFGANLMGALLGTVTPFCSCSSIPIFMGFTRAGLPLGVTFSFLISSPLVDLGSLVLLVSIFQSGIAVTYVLVGLVLAVLGGTLIERLKMEKYLEPFVGAAPAKGAETELPELTVADRLVYAREQVVETVRRVGLYVLVGVGIGALIHNWIPEALIHRFLGANNPFSVVLATVLGVPMYADIFGTIPIAEALYAKGVGIGTVLSFMMAVTALSLPSLVMLSRVVKRRLLVVFVGVVTAGIIAVGYLFNAVGWLWA